MNSLLLIAINAIADFLMVETVIAAVLVGVGWGIIRLGRIKAPVYCHMVWLFTLIGIVIMPVLWLYGPNLTLSILPAQNPTGAALMQSADFQPVTRLADDYPFWTLFRGTNIIAWLWCVGFLLLSTRLFLSGYRLSRIIRSATPVSDDVLPKKVLARKIKLLLTSQVASPVCLGLFRPVILLPEQTYNNSSREELHMMLHHELAHIERQDCWINLFQRVLEAVLFFHPFVWYASFQLTYQREQLCDNHVIAGGVSPKNYVQLLTQIVDQGIEKKPFHVVALFEGKLLTRARSLLELGNKYQIKASRRATVTGVMVMVMCLTIGTVRLEAESVESDWPASIAEEEDLQQFEDDDYEGIVYEADEVDEPPRLIRAMDPIYPFMAKREGIEGRVMVRCVVTKEGKAREATVFKSEPADIFDASVLKAIKQCKFKPAIKDGEAVNVRVIQQVIYKLPPGETVGEDQQYYEDDENGGMVYELKKQDTEKQAIQIQADRLVHNSEAKEIMASGNVVITQKDGSGFLEAEKAVIKAGENKIVAFGELEFTPEAKIQDMEKKGWKMKAESFTFDTRTKKFTASGNVVITLKDGSGFLESEKAVIKAGENKIVTLDEQKFTSEAKK